MRARLAQLVKRLTLDLGSGHDLTVHEIKPHVWPRAGHGGCFKILRLSLPLTLPCMPSFPLKTEQNRTKQNGFNEFLFLLSGSFLCVYILGRGGLSAFTHSQRGLCPPESQKVKATVLENPTGL